MSKYDSLKYWTKVKARIPHQCHRCGATVPKGEFYYKEKVDFVKPPNLMLSELCPTCYETSMARA
ncbi:hypothetical protein ES703_21427 [subsurface metagenome]